MAANDIPLDAGDTTPIVFTWPDSIVGATFEFDVKWGADERLVQKTIGSGITVDTGTRQVTVTINATESEDLPVGRIARYRLRRSLAGVNQSCIGMLIVTVF